MIRFKRQKVIFCLFFIFLSFTLLGCQNSSEVIPQIPSPTPKITPEPIVEPTPHLDSEGVVFNEVVIEVNERTNRMFVLEIDLTNPSIRVQPYLSFGRVFGYELLSEMKARTGAYAAVTAGFFHMYGRPSGLLVDEGRYISLANDNFYGLVIKDHKASIEQIHSTVWMTHQGETIKVDGLNEPFLYDQHKYVLYTYDYGTTNRYDKEHVSIIIDEGIIQEIILNKSASPIPHTGYQLTINPELSASFSKGDPIHIQFDPDFEKKDWAYQASSLLVKNGQNIAPQYDPWIGTLQSWDPRTCVGIKKDGTLVFVVVDGRQPDYSSGVTGKELAEILIDMDIIDALMLDGGSSAQMMVDQKIVNRLSFRNEERPLAGGFMIYVD